MSYVKQFRDYTIKVEPYEDKIWLCIETTALDNEKYVTASGFAKAPTTLERLMGTTWQDKLELKEKELFVEVLEKQKALSNPVILKEIDTFLNS